MTIETRKLKYCPMHWKLLNRLKVVKKSKVAQKLQSNLWKALMSIDKEGKED